ncbi:kynurenine formamidase [Anoplophora glabripennis]|nr:kynurenine formamidase [Anoplophora glabripennis]XP_018562321.1 kynurenine formamidase [Anoplophora glabripennis]XP_018562322.1 kynurenine formamidase [Anoplophora glabripennis]
MQAESELDILYSPSKWSKRLLPDVIVSKHVEIIEKNSKEVQNQIPCTLNIPYGSGKRETYNIFGTDLADDAPIFVHFHGGYWKEELLTHSNNSFIAKQLHKNKIKSILVGYELLPKVSVEEINANITKAVAKCLEYAKQHGSSGLYLSGHSVGGQIVARLFESFIPSLPEADQSLFKGAFLLCGIYDLLPLIKTEYNKDFKFDEDSARAASPIFKKLSVRKDTDFYVVVAENDSPAFVDNGRRFNEYLLKFGIKSNFVSIKNVDHFDIIERLIDPEFELTQLIVNIINN